MSEYIKKEDVLDLIDKAFWQNWTAWRLCDEVRSLPAADVRLEGHSKNLTDQHPSDEFICSNCSFTVNVVLQSISKNKGE